jgi:hypothetical protein
LQDAIYGMLHRKLRSAEAAFRLKEKRWKTSSLMTVSFWLWTLLYLKNSKIHSSGRLRMLFILFIWSIVASVSGYSGDVGKWVHFNC